MCREKDVFSVLLDVLVNSAMLLGMSACFQVINLVCFGDVPLQSNASENFSGPSFTNMNSRYDDSIPISEIVFFHFYITAEYMHH